MPCTARPVLPRSLRRGAAALAVLAAGAVCAPTWAQIHVRAENSGFHYHVTDLDANDGIAADIRFGAAPAYMVDTDGAARVGQREIVNTSDWKITTAPYAIEHDWIPQIHAGAAYDGSAAMAETTIDPLESGFASSSSRVELQPWAFSLAPHTGVTFSMDVAIDMALDPSLAATEYGGVTGAISLYYRQPDGFWSAPVHDDVGGSIGASWADFGSAYSGTRTALVGWFNGGDTWLDGQVVYTVGTIAQVSWGPPAPVPEPATWAMLGVGVGLLGWRARRRKSAAKANP